MTRAQSDIQLDLALAGARDILATIGRGHSEAVYQEAMLVYLRDNGVRCSSEQIVPIMYRGLSVGCIRADVVTEHIVIELKTVPMLKEEHRLQTKKYMKFLPRQTGILINFSQARGGSLDYEIFT